MAEMVGHGVEHVWTFTNVGLGENARICFPTRPPTDLAASARGLVMVDVHPITEEGFWGGCTRCRVIGDFPEAEAALHDLEALYQEVLALCRPGMGWSSTSSTGSPRSTGTG